ncbi:MAG: Nif3-like dinuclear metal center hexameric protein [Tenericutes bacterium HGW-Tenericutes-5]|jgi:dinuclear metal center YbgI/SA1388 family protein|nr:MAG: Nif3-like dinuclear metal center hexameric protein [Tenericutes bacterium HGW-Tenericutes-5]
MNLVDIIKYFEGKFPKDLAYEWDNVGIQVGTLNIPAKKVLITLDVTKEVIKEAIDKKVNMIISHHPLMFNPLDKIIFDTPRGWIIKNLIKHNITVYSAHTNYDTAEGGMNDEFARIIGLENVKLMDEVDGIGRFGDIETVNIKDFIKDIKEKLNLDNVKVIGSISRDVSRVGISGGSGSKHMYQAKMKGCDVYLTGDVTYHTALDATSLGLTVIDIGHHAEKIFVDAVYNLLNDEFKEVEFIKSEINTNPYQQY